MIRVKIRLYDSSNMNPQLQFSKTQDKLDLDCALKQKHNSKLKSSGRLFIKKLVFFFFCLVFSFYFIFSARKIKASSCNMYVCSSITTDVFSVNCMHRLDNVLLLIYTDSNKASEYFRYLLFDWFGEFYGPIMTCESWFWRKSSNQSVLCQLHWLKHPILKVCMTT